MPESRHRHKHIHHPPHVLHHQTSKPKRSAAAVLSVIAAILGLVVAYFTQGTDVLWLLLGAAAGAIIGYVVGHNMDKAIAKSK